MMNTILADNLVSFKELEQKIFAFVCELGREITQIMLESYDKELAEGRDKKIYRNKGTRNTSIKTIYGEVSYSRRVYQTKNKEGQVEYIYLLDQAMQMDTIGLISTNLAEKIALTITESPYRVTADIINERKRKGGRIISVGTTSCRVLETVTDDNGIVHAGEGNTSIFIYPGYKFKAVDALVTNFHLPKSTLLMLVSAFAGRENVLKFYNEAIKERYRFFSFGDTSFII